MPVVTTAEKLLMPSLVACRRPRGSPDPDTLWTCPDHRGRRSGALPCAPVDQDHLGVAPQVDAAHLLRLRTEQLGQETHHDRPVRHRADDHAADPPADEVAGQDPPPRPGQRRRREATVDLVEMNGPRAGVGAEPGPAVRLWADEVAAG